MFSCACEEKNQSTRKAHRCTCREIQNDESSSRIRTRDQKTTEDRARSTREIQNNEQYERYDEEQLENDTRTRRENGTSRPLRKNRAVQQKEIQNYERVARYDSGKFRNASTQTNTSSGQRLERCRLVASAFRRTVSVRLKPGHYNDLETVLARDSQLVVLQPSPRRPPI